MVEEKHQVPMVFLKERVLISVKENETHGGTERTEVL